MAKHKDGTRTIRDRTYKRMMKYIEDGNSNLPKMRFNAKKMNKIFYESLNIKGNNMLFN